MLKGFSHLPAGAGLLGCDTRGLPRGRQALCSVPAADLGGNQARLPAGGSPRNECSPGAGSTSRHLLLLPPQSTSRPPEQAVVGAGGREPGVHLTMRLGAGRQGCQAVAAAVSRWDRAWAEEVTRRVEWERGVGALLRWSREERGKVFQRGSQGRAQTRRGGGGSGSRRGCDSRHARPWSSPHCQDSRNSSQEEWLIKPPNLERLLFRQDMVPIHVSRLTRTLTFRVFYFF